MQRQNNYVTSNHVSRAFTMLELFAVLIVLGLISTIALISVRGHLDQSELMRMSHVIALADRREREATRLSPTAGGLTIDRSKQRLRYSCSARIVDFSRNVRLAEVIVSSPTFGSDGILFSQSGQSSTYAFRLESQRGASNWVLIVGLTGQVLVSDNSDEVRSLLAMGR